MIGKMTKQEQENRIKMVRDKIVLLLTDAGMRVDDSFVSDLYLVVDGEKVNVEVHFCMTRLQVHIATGGFRHRQHKIYPEKKNGTFNWVGIVEMIQRCVKEEKQKKISETARTEAEHHQKELAESLGIDGYYLERHFGRYILKMPIAEKNLAAVVKLVRELEG